MAFLCCCSSASSACLLLALQGQRNAVPPTPSASPPKYCLLHPSPPLLLQLCVGSRVGVGGCLQPFGFPVAFLLSFSTYSGLGEDSLGLGFLGWHHWTLLTIPTKPELLNAHRHRGWNIGSFCFLVVQLYDKRWLVWFSCAVLSWALTGSISMVPGGPAKPSAPGRPGRPGGPCKTEETSPH